MDIFHNDYEMLSQILNDADLKTEFSQIVFIYGGVF